MSGTYFSSSGSPQYHWLAINCQNGKEKQHKMDVHLKLVWYLYSLSLSLYMYMGVKRLWNVFKVFHFTAETEITLFILHLRFDFPTDPTTSECNQFLASKHEVYTYFGSKPWAEVFAVWKDILSYDSFYPFLERLCAKLNAEKWQILASVQTLNDICQKRHIFPLCPI